MSDYSISVSSDVLVKIRQLAKLPGPRTVRRRGETIVPHSAVVELICADILRGAR